MWPIWGALITAGLTEIVLILVEMIVGSLIGAAGFLSMCLTDATTPRDQPRWNGKLQDDGMRA